MQSKEDNKEDQKEESEFTNEIREYLTFSEDQRACFGLRLKKDLSFEKEKLDLCWPSLGNLLIDFGNLLKHLTSVYLNIEDLIGPDDLNNISDSESD